MKLVGRSVCPAILLGWFVAAGVYAQAPLPPTITSSDQSNKTRIVLDKDSRLIADEYVDLLRQLQDVVKDYSSYLKDSESDVIKKYQQSLTQLSERLAKGVYDDDTKELGSDLQEQLEQLNQLETEMRESSEVYPMRTYRLIKSLRREIAGINDLVSNDLADRLREQDVDAEAIASYVRALLANMNIQVQTSANGSTIVTIRGGSGNRAAPIVVVTPPPPAAPKGKGKNQPKAVGETILPTPDSEDSVIHIGVAFPNIPPVPQVSVHPGTAVEGAGVQREFDDTLTVTSPKSLIRIENKMGEVTVTGTSSNQITAHMEISYEADSRQKEKEFGNSVRLQLERHGDEIWVTPVLPKTDGSSVRVAGNELTIEVPSRNPLVVVNNLGAITVSSMQANVDVTGSYSQIEVDDISGDLSVASATGAMSITSVRGNLNLKNSYAGVDVSDCRGDMDIQNSYGAITVSSCRGNLTIKNSGSVEISSHTGDLTVDNSFGPIDIQDVQGSLTATNRFQPITIANVKGPVKVEGANAAIELSNISGGVTASNRFGQISIDESSGPIRLDNQNGSVSVTLGDDFRGTSWINTTFGNISLSIPADANLLLNARTQFGSISSFTPLRITESGQTKVGTLRLGTGRDSLSLAATNASISIDSK